MIINSKLLLTLINQKIPADLPSALIASHTLRKRLSGLLKFKVLFKNYEYLFFKLKKFAFALY